MFGASIGRAGQRIIDAMVRWLARGHINPNILTFIGVAINVGSGLLFGFGKFFWAGIVLIVANLFDMLDGQVARLSGRVTSFGGFLDSSLDRLSDMVVFVGLMVFYARDTEFHSTLDRKSTRLNSSHLGISYAVFCLKKKKKKKRVIMYIINKMNKLYDIVHRELLANV